MVNRVILVGNLGKDPEIKDFENGSKLARFSLATNESYRDKSGNWQDSTEWHNIVCWRMMAEKAQNSLSKGSTVYLEGKLKTRKWQDQNGNDRYTTEIEAQYFRIVSRNQMNDGGAGSQTQSYSGQSSQPSAPSAQEDDLPF